MDLLLKLSMLITLIFGFETSFGHRILGIFPMDVRSHTMMFEQLMKGLAKRGHQVDVISQYPLKTPPENYTDIVVRGALGTKVNNATYERVKNMFNVDTVQFWAKNTGNLVCEVVMNDPKVQKLIKNPPKNPPYDVVIVEVFAAHCFFAFGSLLNVPVVGISSMLLYPWGNDLVANPQNLAISPSNFLILPDEMNFAMRLYNVIHTIYTRYKFEFYISPQNEIIRKHFGTNAPDLMQLEKSLALILTNSHPALNGMKPTTPAVIEVGGLHIHDDGEEIPEADKIWLDESTDGFIYFTFGSSLLIESFPKHTLEIFYKSFAKISPVRILMKVPQPKLLPPGLPKNVRIFSWMPQLKVLQHKNIRAFITHGGMLGTQEAISCAVPMLGVPLFSDQFANIHNYVKKNIAIGLNWLDITEEILDNALHEILNNPMYRNSMKEVSRKFLDRPLSALDTSIFWVEYVIRHGGDSLRSPAMNLTWWQVDLLDVYAALFFLMILSFTVFIASVRYFIHLLCSRKTEKSKQMLIKKKKKKTKNRKCKKSRKYINRG